MQVSLAEAHEPNSVHGCPLATFGVHVLVLPPLGQKSVGRQWVEEEQGVPAPAARQVIDVVSQYWAVAHSELNRQVSPTIGVAHVPRVPMPPSGFTKTLRHCSENDWQRWLLLVHGWPVGTFDSYAWQVLSTSSQVSCVAQSVERRQRAPAAPRVRQLPWKHEVSVAHSLSERHDAPGVPFAVQTDVRQKASALHSELPAQGWPMGFRSRHTRCASQYAELTQTKLGQGWPAVGNRSHTLLRHWLLGPQLLENESHGVPGAGSAAQRELMQTNGASHARPLERHGSP